MLTGCSSTPASTTPQAENKFPEKPIDMTILFGAGGGADVEGRLIADLASKELGQPIVCNNRTGGGGAVGYNYTYSAKPDGYNICWNSTSLSTSYHQGNLSHPYTEYKSVIGVTSEANGIAIKKGDNRFSNLEEFIAYAKAHPGELKVGNNGAGSSTHLMSAGFEHAAGIKYLHVPLDSNTSSVALLGGQVDAIVSGSFEIIQFVEAGSMDAIGVISPERLKQLPDVPTVKEKGVDMDIVMYRGIIVPKDTPDDVVKVLESAFRKAAENEKFVEMIESHGATVDIKGSAEFAELMAKRDAQIKEIFGYINQN
jgi:tripartite-type tricarboxylate transporter receptor subunit TctC